MNKLTQISENEFQTNSRKLFIPKRLDENSVCDCAAFAYDMTFGGKGAHRANSFGTSYVRSDAEIFANVFQGKAAEFAVSNFLYDHGADVSSPDLSIYKRGKWDNGDLFLGDDCISVKAGPSYVNLLRLNVKDYTNDGRYKYDYSKRRGIDDYIVFSRVMCSDNRTVRAATLDIDNMIRRDSLSASEIEKLIAEKTWVYDIPGFITHEDFAEEIIPDDFVLHNGEVVDRFVKSYYDSYYAQTGDLKDLSLLTDDDLDEILLYDDIDYDDDLEL